eukprot:scaffold8.g1378.t1
MQGSATRPGSCPPALQAAQQPRARAWAREPGSARRPASARLPSARSQTIRQNSSRARDLGSVRCRYLRGAAGPLGPSSLICIAVARRGGRVVVAAALVDSAADAVNTGADGTAASQVESLLAASLEQHPQLEVGHLPNGLRYVVLPNAAPPARFEAHLEVHAGSVDEGEQEQGIAHLVEHVTFLGSKKRECLLGTGARSNAYTDFHHTVFHVLAALTEIAFEPEFLPSRIEKERKAVVAEAQMMNTIEYRVDCQLLQYLHAENALGCRFPIGKTEQARRLGAGGRAGARLGGGAWWGEAGLGRLGRTCTAGADLVERWSRDEIMAFWSRHYFPANATLYVVGDVDPVATKRLIEETFGCVPASLQQPSPSAAAGLLDSSLMVGGCSEANGNGVAVPVAEANGAGTAAPSVAVAAAAVAASSPASGAVLDSLPSQHHLVRPPVEHQWGHAFMVRILLSVLQFRVNARYVEADPPFVGIELDHSDSGREGCAVSTLTITSEPIDWRGAVRVAVQEVRRLQRHGVTQGELGRYKQALLRDSEQLAEGAGSVPSHDNLEFVMESLALGHTVLEQRAAHEYLLALADTMTASEVNRLARSLLSFTSHYRAESALVEEYERNPSAWAEPGPTRATAIVACLPAFMDASGHSTGGVTGPLGRGGSLATTQHVDPARGVPLADALESGDEEDVPEGAVRFEVDAAQIEEALAEAGLEVEAQPEVDVPTALLPPEAAAALVAEREPRFVPPGQPGTSLGESATPPPDAATGVVQRRLSNGIRVNYRRTDNEPRAAMVRVVAAGGRSREGGGVGPSGTGVVAVGTRALSESGTVGTWQREQVELFCISKLINCTLEPDEEFVCMDFHFAVGDGGLPATLQLLHLFLDAPRWEGAAMERAKQMYLSHFRSLPKSLERATADRIMAAMFGPDRRFRDPSPEEVSALTLEGMREAVMAQLHAGNLEVSVVGDFDEEELEQCLLQYVGTVRRRPPAAAPVDAPLVIASPPREARHMSWHLRDSDERACAYIAGPAPNRWGNFTPAQQQARAAGAEVVPPPVPAPGATPKELAAAAAVRRAHPLYASITLSLLTEIINSRLFTTVRDTLGLTYDVSFELSLFDRLPSGWFHVNVTSTPQKIREAMMASLRVLRNLRLQPVTSRELVRAQRTLITRHETDLKDNLYWLGLLTHLQADAVPLKSVDCLRDLRLMYETATVDDIYDAYAQFNFDDDHVFTCIGTSGKEPLALPSPILQPAAAAGAAAAATAAAAAGTVAAPWGGAPTPPAAAEGPSPNVDPEVFMAAFRSFMQNVQGQQMQQMQPGGDDPQQPEQPEQPEQQQGPRQ